MSATLQELLKPPFVNGGIGQIICRVNKVHFNITRLIDIRGWGYFQNFENGEQLQDKFTDFVIDALNEKWERDYGKDAKDLLKLPLREKRYQNN